jgi:hypothetical protein
MSSAAASQSPLPARAASPGSQERADSVAPVTKPPLCSACKKAELPDTQYKMCQECRAKASAKKRRTKANKLARTADRQDSEPQGPVPSATAAPRGPDLPPAPPAKRARHEHRQPSSYEDTAALFSALKRACSAKDTEAVDFSGACRKAGSPDMDAKQQIVLLQRTVSAVTGYRFTCVPGLSGFDSTLIFTAAQSTRPH